MLPAEIGCDYDKVLGAFKRADELGSGTIGRDRLLTALEALGGLSSSELKVLLGAAHLDNACIKYEDLLGWVFRGERPDRPPDRPAALAHEAEPPTLEPGWVHTGEVFVHGNGECGQLGLGANADLKEEFKNVRRKPFSVEPLRGKGVCQLRAGALHTAALTVQGEVWTWGCNDNGALGRVTEETELRDDVPGLVTGLRASLFSPAAVVRQISCGDSHMAALDDCGHVWHWGEYRQPHSRQLCEEDMASSSASASWRPTLVELGQPADEVACGAEHTVVRAAHNVFGWGNRDVGQLPWGPRCVSAPTQPSEADVAKSFLPHLVHQCGLLAGLSNVLEPLLLCSVEGTETLLGVHAASYATFVTVQGTGDAGHQSRLLAAGLNNRSQLGLGSPATSSASSSSAAAEGSTSAYVRYWSPVTALEGVPLQHVVGGSLHSAALTADGHVLVWGQCFGDEGAKDRGILHCPQRLGGLARVVKLAAGDRHSLACTEDGGLYTWGMGTTHQLANAPRSLDRATWDESEDPATGLKRWKLPGDEPAPYKVEATKLSGRFVLDVCGGAQHSAELVWDGGAAQMAVSDSACLPAVASGLGCLFQASHPQEVSSSSDEDAAAGAAGALRKATRRAPRERGRRLGVKKDWVGKPRRHSRDRRAAASRAVAVAS